MIRIGIMGCGDVADFGHVPAILQTPGLQLVSLFDPNPARLNGMGDKFGIGGRYEDPEAFYNSGLDAVVVTSPVGAHMENVLGAANHGLHVLCEKPIADNDENAEFMIRAMERADRIFCVGFVYRYSPVAQQIKEWVTNGTVGKIRAMRLIYIWNLHGRYRQSETGEWIESPYWRGRMLEGGPLVDCGVHQIDLARWWLNEEVVDFSCDGAWVADYEAPDHIWLNMRHAQGQRTAVEVSYSFGHTAKEPYSHFSYELIGDGGVLRYNREGYILEARTGQGTLSLPGASEKNFPGMYRSFEEAIRTKNPSLMPSPQDGLRATEIAVHATELAKSRRQIAPAPADF